MSGIKYDLSLLKRISSEDQAFIIDMIETFRKTAPGIVDKMDVYLKQKKYEALSREAHRFIPGVNFLGVKDLEKDLVEVEEKAKSHENIENLPGLLIKIRNNVELLIKTFVDDFNLDPS